MSVFGRIRESLTRTKQQIVDRFDEIVRRADEPERRSRPVDVDTIDALEELLISADIGVAATDRIISAVKNRSRSFGRNEARAASVGSSGWLLKMSSKTSRIIHPLVCQHLTSKLVRHFCVAA